ncbi:zinc finger CCHC domain-containing protein 3-like [Latimeria chalumnae]|uniref:zinc finger CCHC domain-containing protein 3-like n=1 Tax=Latimeria chalumnae TaxID=7897 RepID=UPI00313D391C
MSAESAGLPEKQVVLDWSSEAEENELNSSVGSTMIEQGKAKELNGNGKGNEKLNADKVNVNMENNLENKGKERGTYMEDPIEGPSFQSKKLYSEALGGKKKRSEEHYNFMDSRRKNVVRLHFTGNIIPNRDTVGKDIIIDSLQFTPLQVFAFIHIAGSRDFDISFCNVLFLDSFWAKYEKVKDTPLWKDFEAIKITENAVRYITILFRNESVPSSDVSFWLRRHCTMLGALNPIYDRHGFWEGGYKVKVQLKTSETGLQHLPNFINIGRDRGYLFYPGQPKVCSKCGSNRHFGANCAKLFCVKCNNVGHIASNCANNIVCNLCNKEGHTYAYSKMSYSTWLMRVELVVII